MAIKYHFFGKECQINRALTDYKNLEENLKKQNFTSKHPAIFVNQIHSNQALTIDEKSKIPLQNNRPKADAIVTNLPNLIIGIVTADCMPILMLDDKNRIISATHAGWAGAFSNITSTTINSMKKLGSKPQNKGKIKDLQIAICGDVLHSRVARSNIMLLGQLGAKINLIIPPTLIVKGFEDWTKKWNIKLYKSLEEGISGADVIMMLRIQQERMIGCYIPSVQEYYKIFGLNHQKLKAARTDAIILHPGPINRNVEISSALADDDSRSLILNQVEAGVAVRQAILEFLGRY
jgi:hypothetical protein